jgi:hypothetical protein
MTDRSREIEEREKKATKGPWEIQTDTYGVERIWAILDGGECDVACAEGDGSIPRVERRANAKFIAHARSDISYLLSLVKAQQEKIAELEKGAPNPLT